MPRLAVIPRLRTILLDSTKVPLRIVLLVFFIDFSLIAGRRWRYDSRTSRKKGPITAPTFDLTGEQGVPSVDDAINSFHRFLAGA